MRRVVITPASAIKPRRVRWLWEGRIAYGTLALLAGREGLGKSTLAYHLAARISRGTLPGEDEGNPRAVLVCASEDSWAHTIVPRLIAAGADLGRVYRVEIVTYDDMHLGISLPRDFTKVAEVAEQTDAGLMILDPLMSVIDARLDTHRDREVRQAIEPLAGLADRSRMGILGLIHHNKSGSTDALQLVMGSKAFAAVARSVHTCIPDPDDDTQARRLFATSKNNLGRLDLPVLGFTISSHAVETEDDGTAWTGRLTWTGEVAGSMHEIMNRAADPERGATVEAAQWLEDYLLSMGGEVGKKDLLKAASAAGHSTRTLERAKQRLGIQHRSFGFPRTTYWSLPGTTITKDGTEIATSGVETSRANFSEPKHEPPSRAKPHGDSADSNSSRAKVAPTLAGLGATGADQQEHQNGAGATRPNAGPRAGGDPPLAGLELGGTAVAPTRQLANPPRARADWQPPPAPTCPECGWPVDTQGHVIACEEDHHEPPF